MPTNPYLNTTKFSNEQDLVLDLVEESIAIYGHSVHYVPRNDGNIDAFLGEDPLANFSEAFEIEMYIKSFDGFAGQSEFINKFGLHIEDQITLSVSERRFRNLIRNRTSTGLSRPREGDLIYIEMTPQNRYLFSIRFVENKETLFQLGKLYTYELRCEMMNFSHEEIRTRVENLNHVANEVAYTVVLDMQSGGSGDFMETETVYQGTNLASATATGKVWDWNLATRTLRVQHITGTFAENVAVVGVSSNASWQTVNTPASITPEATDPIADNEFLQGNPLDIVVNRGPRPGDE